MIIGLTPEGSDSGSFRPGGSKSLCVRALFAASLASGTTRIQGLTGSDDVRAALIFLERASVAMGVDGTGLKVEGRPPLANGEGGLLPKSVLPLGESGTLGRFAAAVCAFTGPVGQPVQLAPEGTLRRRSSTALFRSLAAAGVGCDFEHSPGGFSLIMRPVRPPADVYLEHPGSSQELSALLIALSSFEERIHLHLRGDLPSRPYLSMTLGVLERFGARIGTWHSSEGELYSIEGPLKALDKDFIVEPDASSAAVALAAACLSGGELKIPGLGKDSMQGDVRIVELLSAFGCSAGAKADHLWAKGVPSEGARVDLSRTPDLAPVIAAVAAAVAISHAQSSRLDGLGTLGGKESNRIRVLADCLRTLGVQVEAGADFLGIGPEDDEESASAWTPPPTALDPKGDHRMAFAGALMGLIRPGILVADGEVVAKSWPNFWADMAKLGAGQSSG